MLTTLKLAVVGHANVGKTSLLRTLIRNSNFGDVSDKPGTTRHVMSNQLPYLSIAKIPLFFMIHQV